MTFTPKIIGFCGYPRSGKDEAAKVLVEKHNWQRIAFADKLRAVALGSDPIIVIGSRELTDLGLDARIPQLLNAGGVRCDGGVFIRLKSLLLVIDWLEAKKIADVRRYLQRLGTEGVRDNLGEDSWVQAAERSMQVARHVVITDCRFANEAEMVRRRGGLLIWIERPGCEAPAHNNHVSEQYGFAMDHHITNGGSVADLHNRVLELAGLSL